MNYLPYNTVFHQNWCVWPFLNVPLQTECYNLICKCIQRKFIRQGQRLELMESIPNCLIILTFPTCFVVRVSIFDCKVRSRKARSLRTRTDGVRDKGNNRAERSAEKVGSSWTGR